MKKILCLMLICASQVIMASHRSHAAELAYCFIKRLSIDKPITTSEMNKFFTDNNLLNSVLLRQMGYIDGTGRYIKAKPEQSPLGELIRLNFSKLNVIDIQRFAAAEGEQIFFIKGKAVSTGIYKYILFSDYGENKSTELKTVIFTYSIRQKKLEFPIFVNGHSLAEILGFEYKNGIPCFSRKKCDGLKKHLNKVEE